MKKYIIVVAMIICLSIIIPCFIDTVCALSLDDVTDTPSLYFIQTNGYSDFKEIANIVLWIVRIVGESVAVIVLMIMGIKYIVGSVEEKAEYKKTMWPYVLGAILLFAGTTVVQMIYDIFYPY